MKVFLKTYHIRVHELTATLLKVRNVCFDSAICLYSARHTYGSVLDKFALISSFLITTSAGAAGCRLLGTTVLDCQTVIRRHCALRFRCPIDWSSPLAHQFATYCLQ